MSSTEQVQTAYETIVVSRDGAIATVQLNRPDALNAVTLEMGREMTQAFTDIAADSSIRAVILTGAGRGFSSGADLKAARDTPLLPSGKPDLGWTLREIYNPLVLLMREIPQPIVSAVNGVAAGIGCSFALAADYVVAARAASFLLAFRNVALVPDGGASVLVPARAGLSRGLEMALLAEQVKAEDAAQWGLCNELVENEDLLSRANEVAGRLAAGPPVAQAAIKQLLNGSVLENLRQALDAEAAAQTLRSDSDEVVEAITAFLQKRTPSYP